MKSNPDRPLGKKPVPALLVLCALAFALPCSAGTASGVPGKLEAPDLKTATRQLIEQANENGGPDNITCVLTRWIE